MYYEKGTFLSSRQCHKFRLTGSTPGQILSCRIAICRRPNRFRRPEGCIWPGFFSMTSGRGTGR